MVIKILCIFETNKFYYEDTGNKPELNLSSDVTMTEEPNLSEMMEGIRLNAPKNETKFGVSAFARLKNRGELSLMS